MIKQVFMWWMGVSFLGMAIMAAFGNDVISGAFMAIPGILLLPPIAKRIPDFKGRKVAVPLVCICCFIAAISSMSSEDSGQPSLPPVSEQQEVASSGADEQGDNHAAVEQAAPEEAESVAVEQTEAERLAAKEAEVQYAREWLHGSSFDERALKN